MKTLKEKIEVMQAADKGAPIDKASRHNPHRWVELAECPAFNWVSFDYRVRPAKPVVPSEVWFNIYEDAIIRLPHATKQLADSLASPGRVACVRYVLPAD